MAVSRIFHAAPSGLKILARAGGRVAGAQQRGRADKREDCQD
jgi:hypothetical protein